MFESFSFLGSVPARAFFDSTSGCSPVSVSSEVCLAAPARWHCMSLLVYSLGRVLSVLALTQGLFWLQLWYCA